MVMIARHTMQFFVLLCLLQLSATHAADTAVNLKSFASDIDEARYHALISELRCPKCQNQNLADSDAPIAEDLRNELHRLINADFSDAQILDFMQTRYGNFVLYNPPLETNTLLLWVLPLLLLIAGLLVLLVVVRRNRRPLEQSEAVSNEDVENKVAAILAAQEVDR